MFDVQRIEGDLAFVGITHASVNGYVGATADLIESLNAGLCNSVMISLSGHELLSEGDWSDIVRIANATALVGGQFIVHSAPAEAAERSAALQLSAIFAADEMAAFAAYRPRYTAHHLMTPAEGAATILDVIDAESTAGIR